jgi:biotin transport system permease protein
VLTAGYVPGSSMVHRTPAGLKLAALTVGLVALGLARTPAAVSVGLATVLLVTATARLPRRAVWGLLRPALLVCALVGLLQVWLVGPVSAAVTVGWLLAAVLAAGLVTATTPMQALLDAVVTAARPLRWVGVDPDRVALTLSLAIGSVPVVARLAGEVRQARMARGAERSARALVVPLVIRTVRHADRLGEALRARGVDDD